MIELAMVYCMAGEPCLREQLAIFPHEEAGHRLCEIARPAIESAIKPDAGVGSTISFECLAISRPSAKPYQPSIRTDERQSMLNAKGKSVGDVLREAVFGEGR